MAKNRPRQRKRASKTHLHSRSKLAAAQMDQALQKLDAMGVLSGRTATITARIDKGLLVAAARILGTDNRTAIVTAALAKFAAPDSFVDWFLSDRDRLPADYERAI